MLYLKSSYSKNADQLTIVPIGDLHIGAPNFVASVLEDKLKFIDNLIAEGKDVRIILLGDLLESANRHSVGSGVYEQVMGIEEQIDTTVKYLKPYAHIIDCIVSGNHEARTRRELGWDCMSTISKFLGIPEKYSPYQAIVAYNVGGLTYHLSCWHGSGGGSTAGGIMNKVMKMAATSRDSDIYIMGHVHQLLVHKRRIVDSDPERARVVYNEQAFIVYGSTLDWSGSYAEEAGYTPSAIGLLHFTLRTNTVRKGRSKYRNKLIDIVM